MVAPSTASDNSEVHKLRILIADANRSRFSELVSGLNASGIEVTQVTEKSDIMPLATNLRPDLILINLFMNASNTLTTIRELRQLLAQDDTKIIVLTSHYSKANILECVKSGASDFILDPFQTSLVLNRIRYQLQDRKRYSPENIETNSEQLTAGFQLIYDCLKINTEIKDVHQALHQCLKKVAEFSHARRVNLFTGDLESNQGTILATSDDIAMENRGVDLEKYPEVREVLLNDSIVYVKDVTQNPLTKGIKEAVKSIEIDSIVVLPIRHRQETIGTLNVRPGKEEGFEVTDKYLKTFYMVALSLSSKVAAKKLLKKFNK